MKMSLCNTFRLFLITTIVLSIIDTHTAFTLRRTTSSNNSYDLAQEESVNLEVKYDLERLNDVPTNLPNTISTFKTNDTSESFKNIVKTNVTMTSSSNEVVTTEVSIEESTDKTTKISEAVNESTTRYNEFIESLDKKTDIATLITSQELTSIPVTSNTFFNSGNTQGPKELKIYEVTPPSEKRYTTIEMIRTIPITSNSLLSDESTNSIRSENFEKSEKKHARVSLQDASDIGSLEKLKIELLLTTMKQQAAEKQSTFLTEQTVTEEPNNYIFTNSSTFTSTESSTSDVPKYSVESKRAGYLDFSPRTIANEKFIVTSESEFKIEEKEPLRAMFEVESETDVPDEKTVYKVESQSQLSEDALKEELLKEDILSNNEENAKRFREESFTTEEINLASESQINKLQDSFKNSTISDDKLKVKPINMNTEKNTVLYPVNPNYKPLKKIDVQPPKLFLRDPDDNTWRNESLSSLGIVFNPKNSSKPFTQVLKNKTESEWNNISDGDNKSDTPDLRERLQKMAQMRKSKRKKIDSFGNIVYFDYEENNSSEENVNLSKEVNKVINITTPFVPSFINLSSMYSDRLAEVTTNSIVDAEFAKEFRVSSTEKPKKFFNIPEYYDSTDDEEIDYLNMAKIDIKKFTTKKMISTTPKIQNWPGFELDNKKTHVTLPDRKATVQHFPPLKTPKLNINVNDYDNNFKIKLNSYTAMNDEPKHVLPVSTSTTSTMTPEHKTTIQYTKYKGNRNDFTVTTTPNSFKDFYFTRSPMTTDISTSHGDAKDAYVIKNYRDFVNQAASDAEYDKNVGYIPITEVPVRGVTKTEFNVYDKKKTRINIGDDYDDEAQFQKDVLQRFVNNFNHNSHRFKSDYPVLFNNSVIHGEVLNGRDIASSRAFMRGLYQNRFSSKDRACDPHCDFTVELSPAYELHYYVPEQEERQEALPPATSPYNDT